MILRKTEINVKTQYLQIDWSNPLTEGLIHCFVFSELGGNARDLVDNRFSGTLGSASSRIIDNNDIGVNFPSTGSSNSNAYISTNIKESLGNFSCIAGFNSRYATPGYFERLVDATLLTDFSIFRNGASGNSWGAGVINSTLAYIALTDSVFNQIGLVRSGSSFTIYGSGSKVSATQSCSASSTSGSDFLYIGNDSLTKTTSFQGSIYYVLIYNRTLEPYELDLLYENYLRIFKKNNPLFFGLVVPEPPDYIFNPSVNIRDNKPYLYFTTGNRPLAFFDPPEINRGSTNVIPEESDV